MWSHKGMKELVPPHVRKATQMPRLQVRVRHFEYDYGSQERDYEMRKAQTSLGSQCSFG